MRSAAPDQTSRLPPGQEGRVPVAFQGTIPHKPSLGRDRIDLNVEACAASYDGHRRPSGGDAPEKAALVSPAPGPFSFSRFDTFRVEDVNTPICNLLSTCPVAMGSPAPKPSAATVLRDGGPGVPTLGPFFAWWMFQPLVQPSGRLRSAKFPVFAPHTVQLGACGNVSL